MGPSIAIGWKRILVIVALGVYPLCPERMLGADKQACPEPELKPRAKVTGYDDQGIRRSAGDRDDCAGVVAVFLHPECPISNQYIPELRRIAEDAAARQVDLVGIISDPHLNRRAVQKYVDEYKPGFPILFDVTSELALRFQPTHVPEAFVLARDGSLAYRGRINDQFAALSKRRPRVTQHDLSEAIATVSEGKASVVRSETPVGCVFEGLPKSGEEEPVTYHRHIAPIVQNQCMSCHREGEVAPFALSSYEDVSKRAEMLQQVIESRQMPPWQPAYDFGHFQDERQLSEREIRLFAAWVRAGTPEGNVADSPAPPKFPTGWQLGEPDLVIRMPQPYTVPASGPDIHRFFVMPIDIPEDKVVVAAEYRPGNPRVVHHSILYVDTTGTARQRDALDPELGYENFVTGGFEPDTVLGFWASGYTPRFLPDGVGRRLKKGSDLAMQLHLHPSGKEETEQSTIGIYFADKPVDRYVAEFAFGTVDIDIPPGEERYHLTSTFTTPVDLDVLSVTPHMHMVGKEMKVVATLPDGSVEPVIWVKNWDFNWQDQYHYQAIRRFPKGTRFDLDAYFDNSSTNPFNPHEPPQRILFGLDSTDEMLLCGMQFLSPTPREDVRAIEKAIGLSMLGSMKNEGVGRTIRKLIREELEVKKKREGKL